MQRKKEKKHKKEKKKKRRREDDGGSEEERERSGSRGSDMGAANNINSPGSPVEASIITGGGIKMRIKLGPRASHDSA